MEQNNFELKIGQKFGDYEIFDIVNDVEKAMQTININGQNIAQPAMREVLRVALNPEKTVYVPTDFIQKVLMEQHMKQQGARV